MKNKVNIPSNVNNIVFERSPHVKLDHIFFLNQTENLKPHLPPQMTLNTKEMMLIYGHLQEPAEEGMYKVTDPLGLTLDVNKLYELIENIEDYKEYHSDGRVVDKKRKIGIEEFGQISLSPRPDNHHNIGIITIRTTRGGRQKNIKLNNQELTRLTNFMNNYLNQLE